MQRDAEVEVHILKKKLDDRVTKADLLRLESKFDDFKTTVEHRNAASTTNVNHVDMASQMISVKEVREADKAFIVELCHGRLG